MNWWALRRHLHVSWFIAFVCLGVTVGVISSHIFSDNFSSISWLFASVLLVGLGLWRRQVYMVGVVLIAGLLMGLWRGGMAMQGLSLYEELIGHTTVLQGKVVEDPSHKGGLVTAQIEVVKIEGKEVGGSIWTSVKSNVAIKRGDVVTLKGEMSEGFGSVQASMYRATLLKAARPVPGDVAGGVRDSFADGIRHGISEPEASLGVGYLVGQKSALPDDLEEALKIAGLTHVVVASGYNLTILVRLARRFFVKVSKYLSVIVAGGMIAAFVAVTGASPSMSRAGFVAGLSLLAWYYGRKFHPIVLLLLVAAATLLIHPAYGWGDLGWELSFAAFVGVMVVAPLLQRYLFGEKKPGTMRQIIGETVGAEIMTLPLLVLAFGQFSNIGIISNVLILPFVPLAMLMTFIAGVASLLRSAAADVAGIPAEWILGYMTETAARLADIPWAQTQVTVNGIVVTVYYIIITCLCLYMRQKTGFKMRDANVVE